MKKQRKRKRLSALGRLLDGDGLLFTHSRDDGDKNVLAIIEIGLNLLAEIAVGDLDVVLGGTVLGHQVEEAIIDVDLIKEELRVYSESKSEMTYKLVFVTEYVGNIHVVGGRTDILL